MARDAFSISNKEKLRIGELWIQQLLEQDNWKAAGQTCGKVLATADQWEKWVWTFVNAKRFDEIVNYIPAALMAPPLPTTVYGIVLGHYIQTDKLRFGELLSMWPMDLYDARAVATVLENQLRFCDVREESINNDEKGRDCRIIIEGLAKLYKASGRHRDALKCYIKLHDADSAFQLIRDSHLTDAVVDDISAFINLKVPPGRLDSISPTELEEATSEAITLLVEAAQLGLVPPKAVVDQLQVNKLPIYLFYYLRSLWRGGGVKEHSDGDTSERMLQESQVLIDEYADLAVHLFALFDRSLLMQMLKISTAYTLKKVC